MNAIFGTFKTLKTLRDKALFLTVLSLTVNSCTLINPSVTKEQYDRVQTGMSLSQVQDVVGKHGEKSGEMSISIPGVLNGGQQAVYQWQNSDGSFMTAIFVNDKLVLKTNVNLE